MQTGQHFLDTPRFNPVPYASKMRKARVEGTMPYL
jgi:hypothetical protein